MIWLYHLSSVLEIKINLSWIHFSLSFCVCVCVFSDIFSNVGSSWLINLWFIATNPATALWLIRGPDFFFKFGNHFMMNFRQTFWRHLFRSSRRDHHQGPGYSHTAGLPAHHSRYDSDAGCSEIPCKRTQTHRWLTDYSEAEIIKRGFIRLNTSSWRGATLQTFSRELWPGWILFCCSAGCWPSVWASWLVGHIVCAPYNQQDRQVRSKHQVVLI